MTEDRFWSLIDATIGDDGARTSGMLDAFDKLSLDELIGFDLALDARMDAANSWDLWGAAYVANGGASDDGFVYFRYWLISRGRKAFEIIVRNPDDLADIVPKGTTDVLEGEAFGSMAAIQWVERSGKDFVDLEKRKAEFAGCGPVIKEPSGTPFHDDPAGLKKRYPKLWRRFGENPLG